MHKHTHAQLEIDRFTSRYLSPSSTMLFSIDVLKRLLGSALSRTTRVHVELTLNNNFDLSLLVRRTKFHLANGSKAHLYVLSNPAYFTYLRRTFKEIVLSLSSESCCKLP